MNLIGNLLWLIFGGLFAAFSWVVVGIVWCLTIVGIPVGIQCFKFASLSLSPFGKEVDFQGGSGSFLVNILWLIFGGIELAVIFTVVGCLMCLTIIGIPFGKQFFKFAKLALLPIGSNIVR